MAPRVEQIEKLRDHVKRLRPWFSRGPDLLSLVKRLTEAFPETGTVWATKLEVAGFTNVTIVGKASNRKAWLAMQTRLRNTPGIEKFRTTQTRKSAARNTPMTFSCSFIYRGVGPNAQ